MDIPMDWAEKWAVYRPDKVAFKEYESGRSVTFGELNALGARTADWLLRDLGLSKGDRIAVLAENCLEYLALFCACQKSGCILVPLNYRLSPAEIAFLLGDAEPRALLVQSDFGGLLPEGGAGVPVVPFALEDLFEKMNARPLPSAIFDPPSSEDPIFILYTSGSTGWPKGVLYTHGMLHWNSINTGFSILVNADSRTVNVMPPFHTGGWNVLMTPFFHHGGYTCLLRKFDPDRVLEALERERATVFMGVPTMLKLMADSPAFESSDLGSLHYILAGGESMPIPAIELWNAKGAPIRQGYGMTEAGPNLTSLHQDDAITRAGSIGRPNFFVQTRIVGAEGRDCAQGEAGELLIKGPMVTPGYWRNAEATARALADGWLHTGDMVVERAGGFLYVVDRIKNMFISGGENVYPAEIERVLLGHAAVSEAAVVALPDAKWGEVGLAFVVALGEVDPEELTAHCRAGLARFKVPKVFRFVEALPKGDTGKIDRKALQGLAGKD